MKKGAPWCRLVVPSGKFGKKGIVQLKSNHGCFSFLKGMGQGTRERLFVILFGGWVQGMDLGVFLFSARNFAEIKGK